METEQRVALVFLNDAANRAREATIERDRTICELRAEGVPLRTIGQAAGLTHTAIRQIAARE